MIHDNILYYDTPEKTERKTMTYCSVDSLSEITIPPPRGDSVFQISPCQVSKKHVICGKVYSMWKL